ncbi:cysteine desulfurase [Leptospira ryugenii]|uniref:Cysteine desulfurase n=1 Tax=Leptospira ryugenii TaxID=1917863 RepID=A0A2P2E444_9LEPT|nr:cysteine desulfurase [Leptospira ryugenii]GBF51657.1 cysteine desulfurase [Leptospira ryugenii]
MSTSDPLHLDLSSLGKSGELNSQFPDAGLLEKLAREIYGTLNSYGSFPSPTSTPGISNIQGLPNVSTLPGSLNVPQTPSSLNQFLDVGKIADPFSAFSPNSVSVGGHQTDFLGYKGKPGFADIPNLPFLGSQNILSARRDFPILTEKVNGKDLVWLDNAATTQKPLSVIERLSEFYLHENSNIHRAAHTLAARSTDAYEKSRELVKGFLKAASAEEIIFVRGATEGINLLSNILGEKFIQSGDEILISHLEHHANIVPWQMLCVKKNAKLKVAPVDESGQIILSEFERLLNSRTKIVSVTHVSNALGTITPVEEMVKAAQRFGAITIVDGAQSVSHMPIDVRDIDCDFYVFSGHKVFAPTGIGVVYGKKALLDILPPWQGGGNMIQDVTFDHTTFQDAPFRFEAGTGNIADAVGLGAAIDYLNRFGMAQIAEYEHSLLEYGTKELLKVPGLHLIGTASNKASVLSFIIDGLKTEEVGKHLAKEGIAVRAGHHCAQPILRRFGLEATVRPSLVFYNTCEDIDALIRALYDLTGGRRGSFV